MGGKKKAAAKKKTAAAPEEDESVDKFYRLYKKKCNDLGIKICSIIKDKYELYQEE